MKSLLEQYSFMAYGFKTTFGWGQTGNQEIANTAIYDIYVSDYGKGDPTWDAVWVQGMT